MGEKRTTGRKRHILVDTQGNLLVAIVHAANIPDRDGAVWVLGRPSGSIVGSGTSGAIAATAVSWSSGGSSQMGGRALIRQSPAVPAPEQRLRAVGSVQRGHGLSRLDPDASPATGSHHRDYHPLSQDSSRCVPCSAILLRRSARAWAGVGPDSTDALFLPR